MLVLRLLLSIELLLHAIAEKVLLPNLHLGEQLHDECLQHPFQGKCRRREIEEQENETVRILFVGLQRHDDGEQMLPCLNGLLRT